MSNLRSRRARSRTGDAMREHDQLPVDLRLWAAQAALPWSPRSLRRIWQRALAQTGCRKSALARLNAAEAAMLAREAPAVWRIRH
ncbi:DUF6525 family protein [Tabrizicola sp.]|uniref:DUF6525 family protein n=1 Tax=Tabrizicola sp. TaxID=2005166 RepID=UPI00286BAFDD|nr:DUF6525 family protein [Tabrizicola sp.]